MFFLQRCTIFYYVECWTIYESYRRRIGEREGQKTYKSLHPRLARYKLAIGRQRRKSLETGFGIDGAFVKEDEGRCSVRLFSDFWRSDVKLKVFLGTRRKAQSVFRRYVK